MKISLPNDAKTVLIGVSGGADSMALLDLTRHQGVKIIVAHVNYKKRETAERDQKYVEDYCEKYQLKFNLFIANQPHEGNFQDWARVVRYQFFKRLYDEYKCDYLLIAHQQDDALETYLFKKERGSIGDSLAIEMQTTIYGMKVFRPLLNFYKIELREYCANNNIFFGDDESNFKTTYARNKIRIDEIGKMNFEDKKALVQKMWDEEAVWQTKIQNILNLYNKTKAVNHCTIEDFSSLSLEDRIIYLFYYLKDATPNFHKKLSKSRLEDLANQIVSNPNVEIPLQNNISLFRNYSRIYIGKKESNLAYAYTIENRESLVTPYFKVASNGNKNQGIFIEDSDFPLTVRNALPGDKVILKVGHKKIARLFIDKKIPKQERWTWPVLVNQNGTILLITGLYKNYIRKSLQSNVYVIK